MPHQHQSEKKKEFVNAPSFNADSAYYYIEKQLSFGPRVPNTKSHQKCGDYLISTLQSFREGTKPMEVFVQAFEAEAYDKTVLKARNIIASFYPQKRKRILLAAHWDTRPFSDQDEEKHHFSPIMGANDGASGVAVLLEIARVMSSSPDSLQVGVDIILFDVEDYGAPEFEEVTNPSSSTSFCLGSQHWAREPHKERYHAYFGILLDMVGAKNARFTWEGYSREIAPSVLKKVWDMAHLLGYGEFFLYQKTAHITDDHVFVNKYTNIPMIDIIHYDTLGGHPFFEHWHTQKDNIDIIDKNTLKAVGQTLLHVLYNE
ncbi:MAG: M28 family peptidase [Flammeovirgaceae bacterium]|nr:M28 family peptidase [Flammeovirgaceae bacterium]